MKTLRLISAWVVLFAYLPLITSASLPVPGSGAAHEDQLLSSWDGTSANFGLAYVSAQTRCNPLQKQFSQTPVVPKGVFRSHFPGSFLIASVYGVFYPAQPDLCRAFGERAPPLSIEV
jgi:hypothetical protein